MGVVTCQMTVDLETLDTDPSAVLLAIGAVIFHVDNGEGRVRDPVYYDSFYCEINRGVQEEVLGRTVSQSTLDFWTKQSGPATSVLVDDPSKLSLREGLQSFADWIVALETEVVVYGNGAAFDNAILRSACRAAGVEYPWSFRRDACFRSFMMNPPLEYDREDMKRIKGGLIAHNALDDAEYEAWLLVNSYPPDHFIAVSNKLSKRSF